MAEDAEPGTAPTLPILCPECRDRVPDQRALSVHIERHREIKPPTTDPRTGGVVSKECSMGCGRHFMRPSEYREHNPLCDGSPPLWRPPAEIARQIISEVAGQERRDRASQRQRRKKETRMVNCDKCGKTFKDGRGLAGHRRAGCGGAKPGRRKRGAAQRAEGGAPGSSVGDVLRKQAEAERAKAREHEEKADKLEAMAADLDTMLA